MTDCYNPFEEKYECTRKILEQLTAIDCELSIATKSKLIRRDVDLLKKCKKLKVSMSVNTLDEQFRKDMDNASTISERLKTLEVLHENGIYTILFMSPIFPEITDFRAIIEASKDYVEEYWFENLNLRGSYKPRILEYVKTHYPQYTQLYHEIYTEGNMAYWQSLSRAIEVYCSKHSVKYINYFYHEKLVAEKQNKKAASIITE